MDNQPPQTPQSPTPITPQTPAQQQFNVPPNPGKATPSVLGSVGLALALLGVILSFIPAILIIGVIVLFAAFVVSLIALFKKNTAKWPAIVGLVISVIGGAIASTVFVIALAVNLIDRANQAPTTETPAISEQSNSDEATSNRPTVDEIATKFGALARDGGISTYDDMPDFYPCMGKELYNSDVSDESLWLIIEGGDPIESERTLAEKAIQNAVFTCDPQ